MGRKLKDYSGQRFGRLVAGVLLCLWSPLPDSSLAGQEHGRTIPLADMSCLGLLSIGRFILD